MPFVTQRRIGGVVHLALSEADNGGSAITGYSILRGTTSGGETLLATVASTRNSYLDSSANNPAVTYYYKVIATNKTGSSAPNNEISAPFVGDTCNGVIMHRNDPSHPESAAANANSPLAIDYVAVGERFLGSKNELMFKMKVGLPNDPQPLATLPPNSRWRMVWDSFAS